jgi:hypothetical protein
MSSWAKPGVKCVCVDDTWPAGSWYGVEALPTRRTEYTIRSLVDCAGVPCCRLEEIVNAPLDYQEGVVEAAFALSRFRPLITRTQEQDVSIFTPLLEGHSIVNVDA